jgi:hypothetical protein
MTVQLLDTTVPSRMQAAACPTRPAVSSRRQTPVYDLALNGVQFVQTGAARSV